MKGFVLDENVPARLAIAPMLPVVSIVGALGRSCDDSDLWKFATEHKLAIITKDADFSERILVSKPPPWVIHLRFGNLRRRDYHLSLIRLWPRIEALLRDHKLIAVYEDRIEAMG